MDQTDVLKYDAGNQHADQSRKGGQGEQPSREVCYYTKSGQTEQRPARSSVVADHRVDDAPEQQP